MRSLLFVISLLSFIVYKSTTISAPQKGGARNSTYTAEKNPTLTKVFGQLYSTEIEKKGKATGTYVLNKNEIAITCMWPGRDRIPFIIKGRLSPKQNFVNGN